MRTVAGVIHMQIFELRVESLRLLSILKTTCIIENDGAGGN